MLVEMAALVGVKMFRHTGDGDAVGDRTELQGHVGFQFLEDADPEALDDCLLEPGGLRLNLICGGGNLGKTVDAGRGGVCHRPRTGVHGR